MVVIFNMFVSKWINSLPSKLGILNISSRFLITGKELDYNIHCKFPFGSYVQTHEDNSPVNSHKYRTIGAIALGPSANIQGGYYFMHLLSGNKIHRRQWHQLLEPLEVIERV